MVMSEYEKDLKRQQKRHTLSDADRVIVVSELAEIVEERTYLQDAVPATKSNYAQAKKLFAAKKSTSDSRFRYFVSSLSSRV
jgi:hypothetical protein